MATGFYDRYREAYLKLSFIYMIHYMSGQSADPLCASTW